MDLITTEMKNQPWPITIKKFSLNMHESCGSKEDVPILIEPIYPSPIREFLKPINLYMANIYFKILCIPPYLAITLKSIYLPNTLVSM